MTISWPDNFFFSAVNESPNGVVLFDEESRVIFLNRSASELLGLNDETSPDIELIEKKTKSNSELRLFFSQKIRNGEAADLQNIHFRHRFLNIKSKKIEGKILVTIVDSTPVKEAEIKSLNALIKVLEREKKRLAAEIHDGIGPTLSAIKLNLQLVHSELKEGQPALNRRLEETYRLIDDLANDMRSISHALLPKVLMDFGLMAALENLCDRVEEVSDVIVKFEKPIAQDIKLDHTIELNIYRMAQELFNNTLKYADAKHAYLKISLTDDQLTMVYEDDGKGFDTKIPSSGIGLVNLKTRVKAMKGKVRITSKPAEGMKTTVNIPVTTK